MISFLEVPAFLEFTVLAFPPHELSLPHTALRKTSMMPDFVAGKPDYHSLQKTCVLLPFMAGALAFAKYASGQNSSSLPHPTTSSSFSPLQQNVSQSPPLK